MKIGPELGSILEAKAVFVKPPGSPCAPLFLDEGITVGILVVIGDDQNQVNQRPDATTAKREQLKHADEDMPGIKAVNPQPAHKHTQQQRHQPVFALAHGIGSHIAGIGLRKCLLGLIRLLRPRLGGLLHGLKRRLRGLLRLIRALGWLRGPLRGLVGFFERRRGLLRWPIVRADLLGWRLGGFLPLLLRALLIVLRGLYFGGFLSSRASR